jgi:hypothetical protein
MARKFIRQYVLTVTSGTGKLYTIKNPITVDFNITRQNLASLNTATFTLYNLKPQTRADLFHDLYDTSQFLPVKFFAGYGYLTSETDNFIAQCFNGHVKQAYSYRDGSDYKTVIECWDGGTALNNSFISMTMPAETSFKSILQNLASNMLNIAGAVISDKFSEITGRATTLFGSPFDIANKLTGNNFYVDNQTAFALKIDDALVGSLNVIDNSIGILDTPKRTGTQVEVTTMFEPRYGVSQEVLLKSASNPILNGQYKLTGMVHSGVISDAVSGDCKTQLTLTNLDINNLIKANINNYFNPQDYNLNVRNIV